MTYGDARVSFWALPGQLITFGIVLIFVNIPGGALIYSVLGLAIFADFTMRDFQRTQPSRNISISSAPLPEGRGQDVPSPDYGASRTCR